MIENQIVSSIYETDFFKDKMKFHGLIGERLLNMIVRIMNIQFMNLMEQIGKKLNQLVIQYIFLFKIIVKLLYY